MGLYRCPVRVRARELRRRDVIWAMELGWSHRRRMMRVWFLLLLLCSPAAFGARIAVIGDSISTGAHALDREHNGYPARLGHLFEGTHEVKAFAKSSLCLLRKADLPLLGTPLFAAALAWKPDVALVMLGTNDSSEKRPNWKHHGDLEVDARYLIGELRKANPEITIHLLGPPPMFPNKPGLKPDRRADLQQRAPHLLVIRDTYRRIAAGDPRVFFHDLTRVLRAERTSDGIHPDPFGHEQLAHHLHELLGMEFVPSDDLAGVLSDLGLAPKGTDFHGYDRMDFALPGSEVACTVVAPQQAAAGRPWIWRARFFGHQPELDLELLDRGYHLAYCDVANLYGAAAAMERWDSFYTFATQKLNLGAKPILEGMSRGGLPILRWASRHPDRVGAIYGDNPVCDFRSWPGGNPGKRSEGDWARLLLAYGMSDAEAATHSQALDVEVLRPLVEAGVPLALVLGSADPVVPPVANGELLAARYAELGGTVALWRKPDAGHHPHGLAPPAPLRRFLTQSPSPATLPTPSSSYRAGAGWGKSHWKGAFAHLKKAVAANPEAQIVFLGDSITQGLTGHGDRVSHPGGSRAIDRHFGKRKALALGLSGDRTEHLLWRIGHGQFEGLSPEWVVVMIGVNNISAGGHTGRETALGTAAVVELLRETLPESRVLLLGSFPAGRSPDDPRRAQVDALHRGIVPLADGKQVFYQDLRPLFLNPDGSTNARMRGDGIHISPAGQVAWFEAIEPILRKYGSGDRAE